MTLKPGYQRTDIPLSRSGEMLEVDGWAFSNTPQEATVEALKGVIDWDRARGVEVSDAAITEPGTLVGCHSSQGYEMRVPGGGTVSTSGLTWVGVHSAHRRRGILTDMIDDHFTRALARGEVVSTLFAAETAIYQRFGYGLACPNYRMSAGRALALREVPDSDDLRIDLENADAEKHGPIIRELLARSTRPGTHATVSDVLIQDLFLDPELWRDGAERLRFACVRDANGPRAFATFVRKGSWEGGEPSGEMTIWTWLALDAAAERRLFSVITDLDLLSKVKARNIALDAPLVMLLEDVRGAHLMLQDNLWVRILDLPKALAARSFAADADVTIEVFDKQLEANNGLWRLRIAGGTAHATKEPSASVMPDVSISMQDLSAAYLGGVTFNALASAELIGGEADAIAALSAAFAGTQMPVSALAF